MWKEKAQMRNRFLQTRLPDFQPEVINEHVLKEFQKIANAGEIPKLRSVHPAKSAVIGENRTNLAFGNWGLAKIIKEISCDDQKVQMSAMITLSELLLNELECKRAILEFDIVRRLQNILLRRRIQTHKNQCLLPIILQCFSILAVTLRAALQMAKRENLIKAFYEMSESEPYRKMSSCILRKLTQHPQVIHYFINDSSWFTVLSKILKGTPIAQIDCNLLDHFSHFLEVTPQMAISEGFFELILREMQVKHKNQQMLLKCFALLLNCKEGQDLLDHADGIRVLYEIMLDEHLPTYEFIAQAFMSATAASRISFWRCKQFSSLPQVLIRRAHDRINDRQQLYCLQTLRQITTMPSVKKYVRKVCIPQIRNIECRSAEVREMKKQLLFWIKSDVYKK